jgi:hypothetical protein
MGFPVESASPLAPKTTHQEDMTLAGQRKINMVWESTQAVIAVLVVITNMIVAAYQGLNYGSNETHPVVLSSSLFLIVGFYFARTNHSQIGGTGRKATDYVTYEGR